MDKKVERCLARAVIELMQDVGIDATESVLLNLWAVGQIQQAADRMAARLMAEARQPVQRLWGAVHPAHTWEEIRNSARTVRAGGAAKNAPPSQGGEGRPRLTRSGFPIWQEVGGRRW
ncbi:hypothetical protein GCM10012275_09090 [Longimycelium tulufanense]|uniref:Uncharacterized protein n=1 Tax=Longimycelium tulufanense TaxID=907463 RepID=A0A8J3CCQ8_9PSEU|nr:hypothetical protein GCM10012275_09090 [Longimycelium tulufanense]